MPANENKIHFFLGSNTPQGFVSRFDQLADPETGWRSYIIKGGPGTGKSTLMKKVAAEMSKRCEIVEWIHCSSDVNSLDGVIIHDCKLSIADGTPPHVLEPKYPGAFEDLVVLSDCWDSKKLFANREVIIDLCKKCSKCHEYCCRFLAAAGALLGDNYRMVSSITDTAKIARTAARIAQKEFHKLDEPHSSEAVRFLSSVTNEGFVLFSETAKALCDRVILIDDAYGASSKLLLSALRSHALSAGYSIITCYCPLSPFDKLEHLFIPELKLGFMTGNAVHTPDIEPAGIIHSRRFTDMQTLKTKKKRLAFNTKAALQMIDRAAKLLAEAKSNHDQLETYYIAAMDFEKVNKKAEDVLSLFQSIADETLM